VSALEHRLSNSKRPIGVKHVDATRVTAVDGRLPHGLGVCSTRRSRGRASTRCSDSRADADDVPI